MNPEAEQQDPVVEEAANTEHHPFGKTTAQTGNRAWRRKNAKIIARHFHIPFQVVNENHRIYGKARPR